MYFFQRVEKLAERVENMSNTIHALRLSFRLFTDDVKMNMNEMTSVLQELVDSSKVDEN